MRSFLFYILSLLAGALSTFAIPPYGYWWVGVITLALLAFNLHQQSNKKHLFLHALFFSFGFFSTGISWVFVSINQFGQTSLLLALSMTIIFVFFNALIFSIPFVLLNFFKNNHWRLLLGFPLVWVLSEWIRSWIFTGFPWLYLGYGHIDSPIVGWAPIGGVFFLSLIAAFYSSALCCLFISNIDSKIKFFAAVTVAMFWAEGKALTSFEWTKPSGAAITVGIVQPNIPQELKWDSDYRQPSLDILTSLSDTIWDKDLILWPEAAIPDIFTRSEDFLQQMHDKASLTDTNLITGILYDDREQGKYLNSLVALGNADGIYFKQRLVPFGEYVPLEPYLRGLIQFFNLPTSIIAQGNAKQSPLLIDKNPIASAICYEIVYPSLVAKQAKNNSLIITVSNDAWFGESIGPLQHFHMARMRAVETGRYVIRGTNNGISAIINPKGNIEFIIEQFTRSVLTGNAIPMEGNTPFLLWRNYFILSLLFLIALILIKTSRITQTNKLKQRKSVST